MSKPCSQFTKKPLTVEAYRFDGSSTSVAEFQDWMKVGVMKRNQMRTQDLGKSLAVKTPDGIKVAEHGDWVIASEGTFTVCKPAIFEATYTQGEKPAKTIDPLRANIAAQIIGALLTSPRGVDGNTAVEHAVNYADKLLRRLEQ